MALRQKIVDVRSEALKLLRDAATRGSSSETIEITNELEAIENIEREYSKLEKHLEKLARNILLHSVVSGKVETEATELSYRKKTKDPSYSIETRDKALSPREVGKLQRRSFLSKLETQATISLFPKKGALYLTADGGIVALGFATERRKDRFFLGIPLQNYKAVVLLCQRSNHETLEFVLPGELINSLRDDLENRGQFKFNVISGDDSYYLAIRGGRKIKLTEYQGNYDYLRG